eukprot:638049-Hanusia_phi.AAC.3
MHSQRIYGALRDAEVDGVAGAVGKGGAGSGGLSLGGLYGSDLFQTWTLGLGFRSAGQAPWPPCPSAEGEVNVRE